MKEKKVILEIHDKAKNTIESTRLHLVDGAYRTKIQKITEAYKYMLPGDTITIIYGVFKNKIELVDSFEVDYTFPESRLKTDNAVKEDGTKFDRIITYVEQTQHKFTREMLQSLYDNAKDDKTTLLAGKEENYIIQAVEIYFYSNYLTNRPNVGKKNIITINSDNEGFQP